MRVRTSTSANGTRYYIIKTYYDTRGIEHTVTVEKLGSGQEICEKYGCEDPAAWAKERAAYLTQKEKKEQADIPVAFSPSSLITKDYQYTFHVGYLFLQKVFHELGLDRICASIKDRSSFEYNLGDILAKLCYGRILCPSSKSSTFTFSKTLLEPPDFEQHQIYRALTVLSQNFDQIQADLYQNSLKLGSRKTGLIYYDCTNFFFEIEEPDVDGLRKHGKSKENRPLPLVEMGMFIDREGIPLSLCIHPGNTNEQITMRPLEKKMLQDFGMSKFVVCTDAGLSSRANKHFNSMGSRSYITTQSLKKLKAELRETALDTTQWYLLGAKTKHKKYDISKIDEKQYKDAVFYKEIPVDNDSFYERLIVTYSIKYRDYMRTIRDGQVARAEKALKNGGVRIKKNANDFRRFIKKEAYTPEGEIAEKSRQYLDTEKIQTESQYDGFYALSTNLMDEEPSEIAAANHQRWQIEKCFRTMKSEFKSRPVYVRLEDHIKAHFLTCFISLVLYKYLEKKLKHSYPCEKLIPTLREMKVREVVGEGYIPIYTRTDITDDLHESFDFRTDYQIITKKDMKKIQAASKKIT